MGARIFVSVKNITKGRTNMDSCIYCYFGVCGLHGEPSRVSMPICKARELSFQIKVNRWMNRGIALTLNEVKALATNAL